MRVWEPGEAVNIDGTPVGSDPRVGTPHCDCGHSTFRHHGSDRSGRGYLVYGLKSEWAGCKDCTFCDYYKPRYEAVGG